MDYKILFDFTTVHSKGKLVGRSAEVVVKTKSDDVKPHPLDDELLYCCAKSIHDQKPSWKILMLNVKQIIPV